MNHRVQKQSPFLWPAILIGLVLACGCGSTPDKLDADTAIDEIEEAAEDVEDIAPEDTLVEEHDPDAADAEEEEEEPCLPYVPDLHVDDDPYETATCPLPDDPEQRDLLGEALELAGLTRETFGWSEEDYQHSMYYSVLFDRFVLSDFKPNHQAPHLAPCLAHSIAGKMDYCTTTGHKLSCALEEAAARLDRPLDPEEPGHAIACEDPLAQAVLAFAVAAGNDPDEDEVRAAAADIPEDLQVTLAPVIAALVDVLEAQRAWLEAMEGGLAPTLFNLTPGFVLRNADSGIPNPEYQPVIDELDNHEMQTALFQAARDLAVEIDHAGPGLAAFAGETGFSFRLDTSAGQIIINDGEDHVYSPDEYGEEIAFLLDTGGSDTYRVPAGANRSLYNPVSIVIDLDGEDEYTYDEIADPGDEGRLPSDGEGRYSPEGPPEEDYGPYSFSDTNRQGAGRLGAAMLIDLGGDDDEYRSLRMSQGFGVLGVGVLFDDGGDDVYLGEAGMHGAGMFGIGLLIDMGGTDRYEAYHASQGFGYVAGAGWLVDVDGNDTYICDVGDPEYGGDPLYYSPQRAGRGNSSFCQGGGWGLRGDYFRQWWAGGIGLLRDLEGNDAYEASVFGQGVGYWEGIGILSDESGDDTYDAIYYVQGAGAHYAMGLLIDGAGNDLYNPQEWIAYVNIGSGHDYTLGIHIDNGGDDEYHAGGLGGGSGNCNGIGLFVNNSGADTYNASSRSTYGVARLSGECNDTGSERLLVPTTGIFIDSAGTDVYERPPDTLPVLEDNTSWQQNENDPAIETEHGAGIDAPEGESYVH